MTEVFVEQPLALSWSAKKGEGKEKEKLVELIHGGPTLSSFLKTWRKRIRDSMN